MMVTGGSHHWNIFCPKSNLKPYLISFVTADCAGGVEDIPTFLLTEVAMPGPHQWRTVPHPAAPACVPEALLAVTLQGGGAARRGGHVAASTAPAGPDIARLYCGFVRPRGTLCKVK